MPKHDAPAAAHNAASQAKRVARAARGAFRQSRLRRLRRRMFAVPMRSSGLERIGEFRVRILDGPNFYMQYKDEVVRGIYDFSSSRDNPRVIDGGSNIGISVLRVKQIHPRATIVAFEPDPAIFGVLEENVARNGIAGVTLVNAALGPSRGSAPFAADGSAGGRLAHDGGDTRRAVTVELLSTYLEEPIDFLKLNIEGEELPVLEQAEREGVLRNVDQLVIEYHGWAREEQRLGQLLELLDRNGFRYLVHDFDAETNATTKPPFQIRPDRDYFLLVYGKRQ